MTNPVGKIGIFDSGLGGLTILKKIVKLMPNREFLYLGDNLRAPYGEKMPEEIFKHTLAGVKWLFDNGAEIVVLACNTASANALRRIQQEFLPFKHPDKKVLGIIIPTVEELEKFSRSGHIGILATSATVASGVFEKEMAKRNPRIRIVSQSGGKLVDLIEQNNKAELLAKIKEITEKLLGRDKLIDLIVLGCTHYTLIAEEIKQILPKNIKIISEDDIVATKLLNYLNKHEKILKKLNNKSSLNFYTTSASEQTKKLMAEFYGENISVSTATYKIE